MPGPAAAIELTADEIHQLTAWVRAGTTPQRLVRRARLILGSAAVVLVWSSAAAQAAWVARHILFAQRLKKLILPVVLDGTALPNTLIVDSNIIIIIIIF